MCGRKVWCLFFGLFIVVGGDVPSILTNAYAKVAKWGASINTKSSGSIGEGRSSNGQSFFTQSSDVKLRSGQNLNKAEKVVYHYSMPAQNVQTVRVDAPPKAQGFQDRFNPPPAFQFGDSKRNVANGHDHDHDHGHDHSHDGPVYAPPKVSYESPISSYNPIASGLPDASKVAPSGPKYPPFNDSPSPSPAPPSGFKGPLVNPGTSGSGSDYDDSDNDKSPDNGDNNNGGYQYNPPPSGGYQYNPPTAPPMLPTPVPPPPAPAPKPQPVKPMLPSLPISHHYKFPSYVYEHPPADYDSHDHDHDHDHDQDHDHGDHDHSNQNQDQGNDMQDVQDQNQGLQDQMSNPQDQPSDQGDYPDTNSDYNQDNDHKHSLDDIPEYLDHDPNLKGKFNHFPLWSNLYDDHHDHHHVYHPPTTSTTPPPPPPEPEDENRVNKGHYSYYYLGRKLYYVPLYFSVYFIIYITVLILKSIARHKVNFVHELDNVNKGRSLGDVNSSAQVDELAEQTTKAIFNFKRRYIAM